MNTISFFYQWLTDPLRVGAPAPSSRTLATLIAGQIAPECAPIIELGAGSGALTRALVDRGIPEHCLTLVEQSPRFAFVLRQRFPDATVLCADADALESIATFRGESAGAVVSGLPLLLMSSAKVAAILRAAFARLRPQGAFYQFTYGARPPVPGSVLERLGLTATQVGRTLANFPPAAVYRIARCR